MARSMESTPLMLTRRTYRALTDRASDRVGVDGSPLPGLSKHAAWVVCVARITGLV